MPRKERDKGVRGEREVLERLRAFGFAVRGLEASGDHLAFRDGLVLHVETKRQEVARPWLWMEQAIAEAPAGTTPVVAMRRSRSPWLVMLPLDDLLAMIGEATDAAPDS